MLECELWPWMNKSNPSECRRACNVSLGEWEGSSLCQNNIPYLRIFKVLEIVMFTRLQLLVYSVEGIEAALDLCHSESGPFFCCFFFCWFSLWRWKNETEGHKGQAGNGQEHMLGEIRPSHSSPGTSSQFLAALSALDTSWWHCWAFQKGSKSGVHPWAPSRLLWVTN